MKPAADPGYFPVAVERARQEKAARAAKDSVEQEEAAKGHRILDERPDDWNTAPHRLRMLRTAEGEAVDAESIQGKPGVAVYVATYYGGEARVEYFVDDPAALGYTAADGVTVALPRLQSAPIALLHSTPEDHTASSQHHPAEGDYPRDVPHRDALPDCHELG